MGPTLEGFRSTAQHMAQHVTGPGLSWVFRWLADSKVQVDRVGLYRDVLVAEVPRLPILVKGTFAPVSWRDCEQRKPGMTSITNPSV